MVACGDISTAEQNLLLRPRRNVRADHQRQTPAGIHDGVVGAIGFQAPVVGHERRRSGHHGTVSDTGNNHAHENQRRCGIEVEHEHVGSLHRVDDPVHRLTANFVGQHAAERTAGSVGQRGHQDHDAEQSLHGCAIGAVFTAGLHAHNVGGVGNHHRTSRAVESVDKEQHPCLGALRDRCHANGSGFFLVFLQRLVGVQRNFGVMVTRRGVFHVKGGNRTQNQDQPAKHLQRQLQRPIKGLQEVNFQRSQPQGAEAETSHHQTVNQALFGGVEPLHGRRTGASVHKANTITDGQREQHSEPQWTVRHETTQDGTATHHQDAPENHLGRTNFVLHGPGNQHNSRRNKTAHGIGQAQLAHVPFLVETVGSINGLGYAACIVDRTVFKNIFEVRPCVQNTDTEVGQHSEQQDAPALALFLSVSHGIRWNSSR